MSEKFKIIFLAICLILAGLMPIPANSETILCENVEININNIRKLHGIMAFSEPNNFRFKTYSDNKLNSDIGMNKDYFWFWSAEMSPPYLFYGKLTANTSKKLRIEYEPRFFFEALGLKKTTKTKEIIPEGVKYFFFDKTKNQTGFLLKDKQQKTRIKSTLSDYQQGIPNKIHIEIPEDKISLVIKLTSIKVGEVSNSYWMLPDIKSKVSLD